MSGAWGRIWETLTLSAPARRLRRADRRGLSHADPGAEAALAAMVRWLGRAQDRSDGGGFASHFDLVRGWGAPCPAASGLAARTLLQAGDRWDDNAHRRRAVRGLEWLCRAQNADGGFGPEAGRPSSSHLTGQVLLGLVAGSDAGTGVQEAAARAARYLLDASNPDGSWPGERAQDTQIAWALLEADSVMPGQGFAEAAQSGLRWALGRQRRNGWLADCCTDDVERPLTVHIGSAIHGFLQCYRLTHVMRYLDAAVMAGWALVAVQRRGDGSLPGRLDEKWEAAARWSSLSGDAQAAMCWMLLFEATKDQAFLSAARAANRFIRRTLPVSGGANAVGGVRGSFPVDGGYGRFRFLTLSAVHAIDSMMMELALD
ncbi:MAG: hypothetical protein AB7O49_15250 [Sphingomonadales bacterium]